jgi:hypothetical protein
VSAQGQNSALERTLRDLLFREAHLKLARQKIGPEYTSKEAEVRAVKATRSPFDLVIPSRKHTFNARLTAATDAARAMRDRIDLLERCQAHVTRKTEDAIERLLRDSCPEYVNALAARRQKEDWLRCLERFGTKIFELTRSLGNVRNLACSGYDRNAGDYSVGALQAFTVAFAAAEGVEEEVRFANQIATAQQRIFRENGIDTRALPTIEETGFAQWVNRIKGLRLAEAQGEFDKLIERTRQVHESGIGELRTQADQVEHEQDTDIHNFLMVAWEQFRGEIAAQVFSGDTERVVNETAQMLEAEARLSVTGRL